MEYTNGHIQLHRGLLKWSWWEDHNTTRLFIYLLISANWQDDEWMGITIKRGQLVTGLFKLSKNTGISPQSIRTSLSRLKSTNEITIKSTNKYSVISINNYDKYQTLTSKLTNDQQTTNKQLTTNKEYKNIRNTNTNVLVSDKSQAGNFYVNLILSEFQRLWEFPPTDRRPRFMAQNFRKNINKFLKVFNPEITEERFSRVLNAYLKWFTNQDYAENVQTLDAVKRKFPIWSTPQVEKYTKGQNALNESTKTN